MSTLDKFKAKVAAIDNASAKLVMLLLSESQTDYELAMVIFETRIKDFYGMPIRCSSRVNFEILVNDCCSSLPTTKRKLIEYFLLDLIETDRLISFKKNENFNNYIWELASTVWTCATTSFNDSRDSSQVESDNVKKRKI